MGWREVGVVFEAMAVVVLEFEAEMVLLAVGAVMEDDDPAVDRKEVVLRFGLVLMG
jgi:hypothetical protein